MLLSRFPRVSLAHLPTPLEPLPNLGKLLGVNLFIKRDDCTGLGGGGNKTRKLEFLIADALQQKADTVITQGAVQSNHARQTAAAAAKHGMACEILLQHRVPEPAPDYLQSGNVLLDRLFGANISEHPADADMDALMQQKAEELRAAGRTPYVIPGGGSNPIGALGYVDCALELIQQANAMRLRIDRIVTATGSAGTQAGLAVGLHAMQAHIPLLGIGVRAPKLQQEENVYRLACATAERLDAGEIAREQIVADDGYVGDGYGISTDGMVEAVKLLAQSEGILIDPVYSGKGMAGLIDYARKGKFQSGENIVFIHTGGSAGLFGYLDAFGAQGN